MKRLYKAIKITANLSLAMALAVLTLVILNHFNPLLGFLNSGYSIAVLAVFCVLTLVDSALELALYQRAERNRLRRQARQERENRRRDEHEDAE